MSGARHFRYGGKQERGGRLSGRPEMKIDAAAAMRQRKQLSFRTVGF